MLAGGTTGEGERTVAAPPYEEVGSSLNTFANGLLDAVTEEGVILDEDTADIFELIDKFGLDTFIIGLVIVVVLLLSCGDNGSNIVCGFGCC